MELLDSQLQTARTFQAPPTSFSQGSKTTILLMGFPQCIIVAQYFSSYHPLKLLIKYNLQSTIGSPEIISSSSDALKIPTSVFGISSWNPYKKAST